MSLSGTMLPSAILKAKTRGNDSLAATVVAFRNRFDGATASVQARRDSVTTLVNEYYDLVTDFYEFGWGQAFHFAPRFSTESFVDSLVRHEHFLAVQGRFLEGHKVLDVGCGVGGPLRNIVRLTGASVMGVNNNEYQIHRAQSYDARCGLSGKTAYTKTDFCDMPFEEEVFDGAYAIEATCHAASKLKCYSEVFRVLKPGAYFVGYEWILTDLYDDSNEVHRKIRHGIELGDGIPTLETAAVVIKALEDAGFVVEEHHDVSEKFETSSANTVPWYSPLEANYKSISGLKATPLGRWATGALVSGLEKVYLAPKGSRKTVDILNEAAVNLVDGGRTGIFTPCFFFRARKPSA